MWSGLGELNKTCPGYVSSQKKYNLVYKKLDHFGTIKMIIKQLFPKFTFSCNVMNQLNNLTSHHNNVNKIVDIMLMPVDDVINCYLLIHHGCITDFLNEKKNTLRQ